MEHEDSTTAAMTLRQLRYATAARLQQHPESDMTWMKACIQAAYLKETGGKIKDLQRQIGSWRRSKGFKTDWSNVPEKLMLVVTELAEAMEAFRHLDQTSLDRLATSDYNTAPTLDEAQEWHSNNFREELADTMIRLLDLCDGLHIDICYDIAKKMSANELRQPKHGKER